MTQDPDVKANYRIDSVLCLVDAKNIVRQLERTASKEEGAVNEAVQQLAFADSVIVNKTDLVTAEELGAVKEKITSVNAFAKVVQSEKVSGHGADGGVGRHKSTVSLPDPSFSVSLLFVCLLCVCVVFLS